MKTLQLTQAHVDLMLSEVSRISPVEACGLLAGKMKGDKAYSMEVIPMENMLASKNRFKMDPQEQFAAFQRIEANDWELIAIYHSHPEGPPSPSITDIKEHAYPGVLSVIFSIENGSWIYNAYEIHQAGQNNLEGNFYLTGEFPEQAEKIFTEVDLLVKSDA